MGATEEFFQKRLEELEAFLGDSDHSVLRLVIDPEMRRMPLTFLGRRDEREDFPHLLIHFQDGFTTTEAWFTALRERLEAELGDNAGALDEAGIVLTPGSASAEGRPWEGFQRRAAELAGALPDNAGSLAFLLEADEIADAPHFAGSIKYLADVTDERWLKYVVFEPARTRPLEALDGHPKVRTLSFWLSPEEIERGAESDLAAARAAGGGEASGVSGPPTVEQRRALTTVGLMAFTRRDFGKAEEAQTQAVAAARAAEEPVEVAMALYNLGNTYIAAGRHEEAAEALLESADTCIDHEIDSLAPMAYTNLGIALYHTGMVDQGLQSLKVARDMFKGAGHLPGEAHVFDTLATLYHESGSRDEATRSWEAALHLYDQITAPQMQDVRNGGRDLILQKMQHLGYRHA